MENAQAVTPTVPPPGPSDAPHTGVPSPESAGGVPTTPPVDNPRSTPILGVPVSVDPPKPVTPAVPKGKWGGKRVGSGRKPQVDPVSPGPTVSGAPEPPFSGGPTGPVNPQGPSAAQVATVLADPKMVGEILATAIDGAVVAVAKWRYDGIVLADGTPLYTKAAASDKARKDVTDALIAFMAAHAVKVTPGQALVLALGAAYVPTVMALEGARSQALRAAKVQAAA